MNKERISLTISREVLEKVDDARGIVHRSTYLEKLLKNMNMPSAILVDTEGMSKPVGGSHEQECSQTP